MTRFGLLCVCVAVSVISVGAQGHKPGTDGRTLRAGETFKDCANCPEMIVIPGGSFMMGSPESEPGRRMNEPQSRVTIAKAFAVSRTEVTWDQWEACVRARGCDGIAIENALRLKNLGGRPNPAINGQLKTGHFE